MAARVSELGMRGVAFRTLGCKVNRAESEAIASELLGEGFALAEENEAAVVVEKV